MVARSQGTGNTADIRRSPMRHQLTVSIALLCGTVLFATELPGQPVPRALDHVLATIRAAHASHGQGKISSRLRPPPGPVAGGLAAAPPPHAADGSLRVYLDCSPLGPAEMLKLQQVGVRIE